MAAIVREILLLIKSMIKDTDGMTLLNHRMGTLRKILQGMENKLSTFQMHQLTPENLNKLEIRLFQLRPVLLRLHFRKEGDEVEKLQKVAQSREEIKQYDAIIGRLRLDIKFLSPDDGLNSLLSEEQRQKDVKADAKEIIAYLRRLFPYRKDVSGLGKTESQLQAAQELKNLIHENESLTWKHAIFMSKIEPKLFDLAKVTVDLLDESYFDQSSQALLAPTGISESDIDSHRLSDRSRNTTSSFQRDNEDEREARFLRSKSNEQHTQVLGNGAFGAVLSAKWNGQDVALRPIPKRDELSLIARAELRNEALMWKETLQHVNIAKFHGFLLQNFQWYFILEKCDTSLYDVLHRSSSFSAIEGEWRDAIIRGIARGLCFLHENNTLHMNLKPDHILIGGEGGRLAVKLSSFGLHQTRREIQSDHKLYKELTEGMDKRKSYLPYMAPEIHKSPDNWSTSADIYSVGIILWELTQNDKFPFAEYRNLKEAVCEKHYRPSWNGTSNVNSDSKGDVAPSKQARNKAMGGFLKRHASRQNMKRQTENEINGDHTFAYENPNFTEDSTAKPEKPNAESAAENVEIPTWIKTLAESSWHTLPYKRPRAKDIVGIVCTYTNESNGQEKKKNKGFKKKSEHVLAGMLDKVLPEQAQRSRAPIDYATSTPAELLERICVSLEDEEFVTKALFSLVNALKESTESRAELSEHGAIDILLEVIKSYPDSAIINGNAFTVLRMCVKSSQDYDVWQGAQGGKLIIKAMNNHENEKLVQFFGALILGNLALGPKSLLKEMYDEGALDTLIRAMINHPKAELIQRYACWTLANFLRQAEAEADVPQSMLRLDMPMIVQEAMRNHIKKKDVQLYACGALLNLANAEKTMVEVLLSISAHKDVLNAMRSHPYEERVQEYGCAILNKFSSVPTVVAKLLASNTVEVVIDALSANPDSVNISHNAWRSLHNLCLTTTSLPHILKAMRNNIAKVSVQINGCITLKYLAQNLKRDEKYALVEFDALNFILDTVMKAHGNVAAVMMEACSALKAFTEGYKTNAEALIESQGVQAVINVMRAHPHHVELQEAALGVMGNLTDVGVKGSNDKHSPGPLHKRNAIQKLNAATEVMVSMINHYKSVKIQVKGLYVLSELASWEEYGDVALAMSGNVKPEDYDTELLELGAVDVILTAMNEHVSNVTIQEVCLASLTRLAHNDKNRQQILAYGVANLVVEIMEHFANYTNVIAHCAFLLERIVICDSCRKQHAAFNEINPAKGAVDQFSWSTGKTYNDQCRYMCYNNVNAKLIQLIVDSMVHYPDVDFLQKGCSKALRSIAIGSASGHAWVVQAANENPDIHLNWLSGFDESPVGQQRMPRLIGSQIPSNKGKGKSKSNGSTLRRRLKGRSTNSNSGKGRNSRGNRGSGGSPQGSKHVSHLSNRGSHFSNRSSHLSGNGGSTRQQSRVGNNTYSRKFGKGAAGPPPGLTAPGLSRHNSSKVLIRTTSSNNVLKHDRDI